MRLFFLIFVIHWVVNDIQCSKQTLNPDDEKKNSIDQKILDIIKEKFEIKTIGVYDQADAVNNFDMKFNNKVESPWRTPEICKWGNAMNQVEMPQEDNICNIVAVKLSTLKQFTSKSATMIKHYVPYKCLKLPINNVKSKRLFMKPNKTVMYCPTTIILESIPGNEPREISVNRFLIGRGDDRRNSIYVYHLNDAGKSMDLIFYMYNVLTYFAIEINSSEYPEIRSYNFRKQYAFNGLEKAAPKFEKYYDGPGFVKSLSYKELCSKSIEKTSKMCKNLSVLRIASRTEEKKNTFLVNVSDNIYQMSNNLSQMSQILTFQPRTRYVDTSGFIPYVCVRRPVLNFDRPIFLKNFKLNMIFCPEQIITVNNRKKYKQPAFLYSAGDFDENSHFIYDIEYQGVELEEKVELLKWIKLSDYVSWKTASIQLTETQTEQIEREIKVDFEAINEEE